MINLLVTGISGRMGAAVREICGEYGARTVCGVDGNAINTDIPVYPSFSCVKEEVDAIIDFSSPSAVYGELGWAQKHNIPVVIAATGYSEGDSEYIRKCSAKIPVLVSANYSLGIALLKKLVREAAEVLGDNFDIEIIEKHHRFKQDAPSGTALALAESAGKPYICGRNGGGRGGEIGIHSVRGGTVTGEHEVIFAGNDEILTLSHTALSKKIFAAGAVKAAKWIIGKPPALYGTEDMLEI